MAGCVGRNKQGVAEQSACSRAYTVHGPQLPQALDDRREVLLELFGERCAGEGVTMSKVTWAPVGTPTDLFPVAPAVGAPRAKQPRHCHSFSRV